MYRLGLKHSLPTFTDEWKARVDLAAIYRLCHLLGFNEGINNHLTAAVPDMPDHFLVFPFGLLWSEVTASNLLLVDSEVRRQQHKQPDTDIAACFTLPTSPSYRPSADPPLHAHNSIDTRQLHKQLPPLGMVLHAPRCL